MYRFVFVISLMVSCSFFSSTLYSQTMQTMQPTTPLEIKRQKVRDDRQRRLDGIPGQKPSQQPSAEQSKAWKEASEKLAQLRQVNPEDELRYKQFLAAGDGGLFRIFPDFDCNTDFTINSDHDCAAFVDGGSSYSFRARGYSVYGDAFSDIKLNHNKLISGGSFLQHGVLVSLGDIPIENVKLTDNGLRFLVDLQPSKNNQEAVDLILRLKKGIESENYTYADNVEFSENKTYALRLIAYQYSLAKAATKPEALADRKNRMDLIVVFRAVRRDENGSITILWKELRRKPAPSLSN